MSKIRICSIKQEFYDLFDNTCELDKNYKRPCLIVLKLKYKGKKYDFAIPFRSNIYGQAKREEYFPLPPRKTTKKGKKLGLHYIKMFPIIKRYINSYYSDNKDNENDVRKIEKNFKKIVDEAQDYLKNYEDGTRYNYCVDIDRVIKVVNNNLIVQQEAAPTLDESEKDNNK